MNTVAIDIDLRRISAVCGHNHIVLPTVDNVFSDLGPLFSWIRDQNPTEILIEVASASSHGKPWHRSRVAWALWNIAAATRIQQERLLYAPIYVASSAQWTNGLPEDVRHKLAGVHNYGKTKRDKHDLNDCEAMVWSFRLDRSRWTDLPTYLNNLT